MPEFVAKLRALLSAEGADGTTSNRAKLLLAFPAMPVTISNVLIHNAYIKYYSDVIGLDVGFVGTIYLIFGIWNAINDPMLGVIIDRFKYSRKRGKYVYFMRVTVPLIVFSSFAMLFSQPAWNEWAISRGTSPSAPAGSRSDRRWRCRRCWRSWQIRPRARCATPSTALPRPIPRRRSA